MLSIFKKVVILASLVVLVTPLAVHLIGYRYNDDMIHFYSVKDAGNDSKRITVGADAPFSLWIVNPEGKTIFRKDSDSGWFGRRHDLTLIVSRREDKLILDGVRLEFSTGEIWNVGSGMLDIGRGVGLNLQLEWEDGYALYWGDVPTP